MTNLHKTHQVKQIFNHIFNHMSSKNDNTEFGMTIFNTFAPLKSQLAR
jgi:hypothetical protein